MFCSDVHFGFCFVSDSSDMRKDCFQNKSKFITEDHFTKHMNITICELNLNEIIYKR